MNNIGEFCSNIEGNSFMFEICNQDDVEGSNELTCPDQLGDVIIDEPVKKVTTCKKSLVFVQSRGCPIRHLAWLEANRKLDIPHVPKHEDTIEEKAKHTFVVQQEQFQFMDLSWRSDTYDSSQKGKIIHLFQEVLHQVLTSLLKWFVLHLYKVSCKHARY